MANIFDKILAEGHRRGTLPGRTQAAREWFRKRARRVFTFSKRNWFHSHGSKHQNETTGPGSMQMFFYDPKLKDELPYYDKFPLVFVVEMYADGFLGINLHYLPHTLRANLMDELYTIVNNTRYDVSTRLRLSYSVLRNASRFKLVKPCIKRYLYAHVRSPFMAINAAEWDIALMLPLESFEKAGRSVVWADSVRKATI